MSLRQRLRRLSRLLPMAAGLAVCLAVGAATVAVVDSAQPDRVEVDLGLPAVFHALPELTTTIAASGPRPRYVRLALSFEVAAADVPRLQAQEPLLLGVIQDHLRTLTAADLAGEAGAEALRGVVRRLTETKVAPVKLRSVLFTQFLIS